MSETIRGYSGQIAEVDSTGHLYVVESSPVPPVVGTATITATDASTTNQILKAANTSRKGLMIQNTDASCVLYCAFASTATSALHTVSIPASSYYELPIPVYTGVIAGTWASSTTGGVYYGKALVTELT